MFYGSTIASIEDYPERLLDALLKTAPASSSSTPTAVGHLGVYNSAYFEHSFLAQQMGIQLVNGTDLFVDRRDVVWMKTTSPQRVDVIYRRIDDDFLSRAFVTACWACRACM